MTQVLAVDPGLASIGWARLSLDGRRPRCLACDTICTKPTESLEQRFAWIRQEVMRQLQPFPITVFAIEDQAGAQIAARKLGKTDANAAKARDVQHQLMGMAAALAKVVAIESRSWRSRLRLSGASDAEIVKAARMLCDGVPTRLSIHAAEAICIGIAVGREMRVNVRKAG